MVTQIHGGWRDVFYRTMVAVIMLLSAHGARAVQLAIDRNAGGIRLEMRGESGGRYLLQYRSDLGPANPWRPLLGGGLSSAPLLWSDPDFGKDSFRFYRLLEVKDFSRPQASNFRLIDDQGKSRELYYHTDAKAIVIVFTGKESIALADTRTVLAGLKAQFENKGVLFWLINSNSDESRDQVIEQGTTLGMNLPILHDQAQLVAREYGAGTLMEVVAIDPRDWTVFYRGAISQSSASYLVDALNQFTAEQALTLDLTPVQGRAIRLSASNAVSYEKDVAPILLGKCIRCHSPGNIGPFAMTNHAIIKDWSASIKGDVLSQHMPPWHADPHYGSFNNDLSLKPEESAKLVQWINDGAEKGSGADPLADFFAQNPPPPDYPLTWPTTLGEPDYIITLPKQDIPPDGHIDYRYATVPIELPPNTWLRAAVILPGNIRVVHHVLASIGETYSILNSFVGYAPGNNPAPYPDGTGRTFENATHLSFEMHYTPTGEPETDQTRVGLYFHKVAPKKVYREGASVSFEFAIPANAREYTVPNVINYRLEKAAWLYSMTPHMHYRGLRMKYEAQYPDGSKEILLNVPHYSFEWQTTYFLKEPKYIPAGTRILLSGAFDNSALNEHNPDPNKRVTWGEQSDDEMFIGFFTFIDAD